MLTPLPKVGSPEVQRIADEDSANLSDNICLNYEEEVSAFKDKLRYVTILGFFPLHAPIGVFVLKSPLVQSQRRPHRCVFFERSLILPREFSICHLHSLHANL